MIIVFTDNLSILLEICFYRQNNSPLIGNEIKDISFSILSKASFFFFAKYESLGEKGRGVKV